jgi:NADH-quinone oxidoreductase subunit H
MVAVATLLERKLLGTVQRRRGPNVNGYFGLAQPVVDALKLIFKEILLPTKSTFILFYLPPFFFFIFSLLVWVNLPFLPDGRFTSINTPLLVIMALGGLNSLKLIIAG